MPHTLTNATVACLAPANVERTNITVDGGRIMHIGSVQDASDVIDCSGKVIMPGNVCAHTHLYSALARGMPAPPSPPQNFPEILQFVWWRLDRALDEASIRASALIGIVDAVRAGTTTLVDHHASPNWIDGSLDVLADAFVEVGARGLVCYEVTDRGGPEKRDAGLRENERFLERGRYAEVKGMVGAHASFTLDDGTLERLAALSRSASAGVHIHVAEDVCDEDDSVRRSGKRTAARLHDAGVFVNTSIAAHGVHLDGAELELVQSTDAWLVHNCRSNMNNRVGRAPVDRFGDRGVLGTDGIDGDMFAESRTAFFRAREQSLSADASRYTSMLGAGGRLASTYFPIPIGSLRAGAAADLIVLDYRPPTPLDSQNLAWHWMFGMHAGQVESVMIDGEWVIRDREFVTIDEEKIRAEAQAETVKLWQRMESL